MPRRKLSPEEIKDAADKAEGLKPPEPETRLGRPPSYRAEYAGQANKLCLLGATDIEMADFFGIHVATLYRWKIEYPEFCEAIKSAKDVADERVERSLYQRAVGYTFESEKVFVHGGEIIRAQTREHVAPDTTAMIFWLKNRRSQDWRDRREIDLNADALSQVGDEELESVIAALRSVARSGVPEAPGDGTGKAPRKGAPGRLTH